jgi:UDP-N-acetylmuramoylalanine--D-glutamate ligase
LVAVRPPLPSGPYLVVGLARSGAAVAQVLAGRGERVVGVDSAEPAARDVLAAAGVEVDAPSDGLSRLGEVETVVKSPGVPPRAPVIAAAREAGRTVIGEFEIAWRLLDTPWLAVTGTNGKSTTVEWAGHVHRIAGIPVAVAGNVGTPLSGLDPAPGKIVIAEASSYQLADTLAFAPEAAILLNITPDHLDWHGGLEAYVQAKLRAFARQRPDALAVLPAGGIPGVEVQGQAERVTFGAGGDAAIVGGSVTWRGERLLPAEQIALRGAHNAENALAVAALCLGRGLDAASVAEGLRTFQGVPHRLEEIRQRRGVAYVNDSKATNVASAVTGLSRFPGGVHAILGGRAKEGGYDALARAVAERAAGAYLIGEAAGALRAALEPTGVALHDCGDLESALAAAAAAARSGETVLLSPACASFDAYDDFEARGDHFRALVEALPD